MPCVLKRKNQHVHSLPLTPGPSPGGRGEKEEAGNFVGARWFALADLTPGPSPQAERGERWGLRWFASAPADLTPGPSPQAERGERWGLRWFASADLTPGPSPQAERGERWGPR